MNFRLSALQRALQNADGGGMPRRGQLPYEMTNLDVPEAIPPMPPRGQQPYELMEDDLAVRQNAGPEYDQIGEPEVDPQIVALLIKLLGRSGGSGEGPF